MKQRLDKWYGETKARKLHSDLLAKETTEEFEFKWPIDGLTAEETQSGCEFDLSKYTTQYCPVSGQKLLESGFKNSK